MRANILVYCVALLVIACSDSGGSEPAPGTGGQGGSNPPSGGGNNSWLIPVAEVRDGGAGKDGIPSIDSPVFSSGASDVSALLEDNDIVIGLKVGNEVRAYPHYILDWHEIVNDALSGESIAITYCPLTGTAIGWDRVINGVETNFGVSGLLYNNNLIPYDRRTDSNWSQIRQQCVNGDLIGQSPEYISMLETTWGVWKTMYPDAKVLSEDTGFDRNYSFYPYGDYPTNNNFLLFPLSIDDNRLPRKERVHTLVQSDLAKAYRFASFNDGSTIRDQLFGKEILIVGDQSTIVSFELDTTTSALTFEYAYNGTESFFTDNEGTSWNIFGEGISGPRQGVKLRPTESYMAYWFSIGAFFPNAEIYE